MKGLRSFGEVTTAAKSDASHELFYEMGITRFFGLGDINGQGLSKGWAPPEEAHIWNDGPDAEMVIAMAPPEASCTIVAELAAFVSERHPLQEVTLFANGARVGFWRFYQNEPRTIEAVVEREHFFERGGKSLLRLTWHIPYSVRPVDVGEGGDTRELGLSFRSLSISEVTTI